MTTLARIHEIADEKVALAIKLFGVDIGHTVVKVDINAGTFTGQARARYRSGDLPYFEIRLHTAYLGMDDEEAVTDTIAHEIAHVVTYSNQKLGKNHDRGWQRICKMLGGNGERINTHNIPIQRKKQRVYVYFIGGEEIKLSKIRHNRLQSGYTSYSYRCRNTGQTFRITKDDFQKEVVI